MKLFKLFIVFCEAFHLVSIYGYCTQMNLSGSTATNQITVFIRNQYNHLGFPGGRSLLKNHMIWRNTRPMLPGFQWQFNFGRFMFPVKYSFFHYVIDPPITYGSKRIKTTHIEWRYVGIYLHLRKKSISRNYSSEELMKYHNTVIL